MRLLPCGKHVNDRIIWERSYNPTARQSDRDVFVFLGGLFLDQIKSFGLLRRCIRQFVPE